jgi:acyl-coenzyme A synthetase/AMP-(fatty) acid ligase
MMVGGEALPVALAQELTSVVKGTVTNMYGPTETTIWSSTQKVEPGMSTIPIGTPIANTQLYVLDSRLQPAPVGVPGELYIGGDGVVRGYLNRPELTGERFLTDPFKPNGKIYKTGDLVRWREDGVVEFLGRTDFQVKIRGYRIELGEIESALGRIAGVREAVVVAREDTPGDQRLVAYVVPDGATPPDAAQLRDQLRAVLPEPMVPSAFVVLDALPLTPNGKVDRRALPAPEPASHRPKTDFVAPDGALQRTVAELWLETLGLKQVGVDDNFFEIGGHSLLVVRLHRQLREKLPDHSVAITDLYRFPTIRSFTESLTSGGKDERLQATAERAARRRDALARRRQS